MRTMAALARLVPMISTCLLLICQISTQFTVIIVQPEDLRVGQVSGMITAAVFLNKRYLVMEQEQKLAPTLYSPSLRIDSTSSHLARVTSLSNSFSDGDGGVLCTSLSKSQHRIHTESAQVCHRSLPAFVTMAHRPRNRLCRNTFCEQEHVTHVAVPHPHGGPHCSRCDRHPARPI